jgi:DnaJ-class molecular chaperone
MTGGGQVDYYAVLGVPRDASVPDIRRAYRRVVRQHHPDLTGDPDGSERFVAAVRAYEVLNDPAARARYDEQSEPHSAPIRRSPAPAVGRSAVGRRAVGLRGVLELTALEAAYAARFPLTLTDGRSVRIVVPAGTRNGDELMLRDGNQLIVLQVRLKNDLT